LAVRKPLYYPNPFNRETVIRFALPEAQEVELTVYSLAGQQVATRVDGLREAGTYTIHWDGRDDEGRKLTRGVINEGGASAWHGMHPFL